MPRAYDARAGERPLFDALLDARDRYGAKKPILEDQDRNPLTYTDLIRASFALGRKIALSPSELRAVPTIAWRRALDGFRARAAARATKGVHR